MYKLNYGKCISKEWVLKWHPTGIIYLNRQNLHLSQDYYWRKVNRAKCSWLLQCKKPHYALSVRKTWHALGDFQFLYLCCRPWRSVYHSCASDCRPRQHGHWQWYHLPLLVIWPPLCTVLNLSIAQVSKLVLPRGLSKRERETDRQRERPLRHSQSRSMLL